MQGTGTGSFKNAVEQMMRRSCGPGSALLSMMVDQSGVQGHRPPSAASSPDMMTAERPSWAELLQNDRHLLPM